VLALDAAQDGDPMVARVFHLVTQAGLAQMVETGVGFFDERDAASDARNHV